MAGQYSSSCAVTKPLLGILRVVALKRMVEYVPTAGFCKGCLLAKVWGVEILVGPEQSVMVRRRAAVSTVLLAKVSPERYGTRATFSREKGSAPQYT